MTRAATAAAPRPPRAARNPPGHGRRPATGRGVAGGQGRRGRVAAAPGPAVRLPGARRPGRGARSRGLGSASGSPVGWSTASCSTGYRRPTTTESWGSWTAWYPPNPSSLRRLLGSPAPSLTATPGCWPTCCGWPCRRGTPGPRRSRPPIPLLLRKLVLPGRTRAGGATGPGPRFWTPWPRAGRRAPSGRHCRGRTGPARLAGAAAAAHAAGRGALLLVPDARDLARLVAALAERATGRTNSPPWQPISGPPSDIGGSWRCDADGCASRSAPGRRRSPLWSGWACWRCGTTATTCSPSSGRPTRTPGRCCWNGRLRSGARCCWAGSPGPRRAQLLVESGWAHADLRNQGCHSPGRAADQRRPARSARSAPTRPPRTPG